MTESCNNCKKDNVDLRKCSSCGKVSYCSVECQKADWKKHKVNCTCFICREVEGKGKGLIATRAIKQGEVLMREDPIILIEKGDSKGRYSNLKKLFEQLPDNKKKRIMELCDNEPDGPKEEKLRRIFQANAIDALNNTCAVIYANIPRLNHSCNPNCVWSYVENKPLSKEVRALRAITAGEEIVVSYINSWEANLSSHVVRQKLLRNWQFDCMCSVCSLPEKELQRNDQLRENIMKHHSAIPKLMSKWQVLDAIASAKTIIELINQLRDELLSILPAAYLELHELIQVAKAAGQPCDQSSAEYLQQAKILSDKFGPSFQDTYHTKVAQIEAVCINLSSQKSKKKKRT